MLLIATLLGCGDDGAVEEPDAAPAPAQVQLELVNKTPGVAALWHAYIGNEIPDELGIKLIAVTLRGADVDPQLAYLHPDCVDLDGCALADGPGVTGVVGEFLELVRPSAEVNQGLAAGMHSLPAGSYPIVRLHWKRDVADGFNARYEMEAWQSDVPVEFNWGIDPTTDASLLAPIELAPGATARLSLAYDLDGLILHNVSIDGCEVTGDPNCYAEGQDRWFISGDPQFNAALLRAE